MTIKNNSFASAVLIDLGDDTPPVAATAQMVPFTYTEEKTYSNTRPSSFTTTITPYPPSTHDTAIVPYSSRSVNPYSAESIRALQDEAMATKQRRRRRRRIRTSVAAVSGAVVGGVALGPLGAIAGGVGAAAATRGACKLGERRKDRRVEKQNVQQASVVRDMAIANAVSA